jgi:hypothetical protein
MGSRARDLIGLLIGKGTAPLLKEAGFRKSGLRFDRHLGQVVQVIEFQLSQANFADTGRFYVNVGLGFDGLWNLEGRSRPPRPKAHECQVSKRLEEVRPEAPAHWDVSASTDLDALSGDLSGSVSGLLGELDGITSIGAMLEAGWLRIGADLITRAKLRYVGGDHKAALSDLRSASEFFSDRRGMSLGELIGRSGLTGLAPGGDGG